MRWINETDDMINQRKPTKRKTSEAYLAYFDASGSNCPSPRLTETRLHENWWFQVLEEQPPANFHPDRWEFPLVRHDRLYHQRKPLKMWSVELAERMVKEANDV